MTAVNPGHPYRIAGAAVVFEPDPEWLITTAVVAAPAAAIPPITTLGIPFVGSGIARPALPFVGGGLAQHDWAFPAESMIPGQSQQEPGCILLS